MSSAYLIPITEVTIGTIVFTSIKEWKVITHYDKFTDTATITLPRNIKFKGKEIKSIIQEGDAVKIKAGYSTDTELYTEFIGYVSEIAVGTPLVIKCEDEMWKVKEAKPITKKWKNPKLKTLISEILPNYALKVADVELGDIVANNASVLQILEEIKSKYGLRSWYRAGVFYCDFANHRQNDFYKVVLEKNSRAKSLNFVDSKSKKLQIKAIANLPSGTKRIVTVGDAGGDSKTLNFANISETELRKYATEELNRVKFDGVKGSVSLWAIDKIEHSDVIKLDSIKYPEYKGDYLVDGVEKGFSVSGGYYRMCELGLKL